MKLIVAFITLCCCLQVWGQDKFPDGKLIPDWFRNNESVNINSLGKQYRITDYGVVNDSAKLQTEQIQNVIDRAAKNGGGVIVIPKGTFLSGSLFFKPKTHLYLEENAVLKGSDDAGDFRIQLTRMEGQTVKYYTALIMQTALTVLLSLEKVCSMAMVSVIGKRFGCVGSGIRTVRIWMSSVPVSFICLTARMFR